MRRKHSIEPDYFEQLYREQGDPWQFATSIYEREKYQHSLDALPQPHYESALEIGCSIGVFTRQLAGRCGALLAVDVSSSALAMAQERCAGLDHVTFALRQIPQQTVAGPFDLILLSEVAYYWDRADLRRAAEVIGTAAAPMADLLLVHYTAETDYPLSGDDAVDGLRDDLGEYIQVLRTERRDLYRLDLWRRSGKEFKLRPPAL